MSFMGIACFTVRKKDKEGHWRNVMGEAPGAVEVEKGKVGWVEGHFTHEPTPVVITTPADPARKIDIPSFTECCESSFAFTADTFARADGFDAVPPGEGEVGADGEEERAGAGIIHGVSNEDEEEVVCTIGMSCHPSSSESESKMEEEGGNLSIGEEAVEEEEEAVEEEEEAVEEEEEALVVETRCFVVTSLSLVLSFNCSVIVVVIVIAPDRFALDTRYMQTLDGRKRGKSMTKRLLQHKCSRGRRPGIPRLAKYITMYWTAIQHILSNYAKLRLVLVRLETERLEKRGEAGNRVRSWRKRLRQKEGSDKDDKDWDKGDVDSE
ncbi:hypothetical protein F5877DRAFT_73355 [Lentinula edodes]|nr:hypothetical protein F5877DRAFT_73355 [Lentinula edodes]